MGILPSWWVVVVMVVRLRVGVTKVQQCEDRVHRPRIDCLDGVAAAGAVVRVFACSLQPRGRTRRRGDICCSASPSCCCLCPVVPADPAIPYPVSIPRAIPNLSDPRASLVPRPLSFVRPCFPYCTPAAAMRVQRGMVCKGMRATMGQEAG